MNQSERRFKVIIIGSGLAGSLLANGLIHNGVDVHVYERLQRHAEREGYQIRLGAAALKGMRACLTQEQIDAIVQKFGRSGGLRSGAPVLYDNKFRELMDLTVFPSYSKSAPIRRGILRDLLADPVFESGKLHYGRAFVRYEIMDAGSDSERVRVAFDDGSTDECDVLIGADGSHSKVNELLGLNNISQIKSHVSMICKNELPTSRYLQMTPRLRQKPALTFADGRVMFFSAYLPDKLQEGQHTKDSFDESLSAMMFGAQIPTELCPEDISSRSTEEKWEFISSVFQSWSDEHHEIIDLVKGCDVYVYKARASSRPAKNWRSKVKSQQIPERGHPRVWLLGDAVHAMLPLRGMGGNQSMNDTAIVLPLLTRLSEAARHGNSVITKDIAKSCHEYEDEMIPRAFSWVQKSGGSTPIPVDSSTTGGKVYFFLVAVALRVSYIWYKTLGLFTRREYIDDAPELRD